MKTFLGPRCAKTGDYVLVLLWAGIFAIEQEIKGFKALTGLEFLSNVPQNIYWLALVIGTKRTTMWSIQVR